MHESDNSFSSRHKTETSPFSVNFMEFPVKFDRICLSLPGSPLNKAGTSGAAKHINSRPFSSARRAIISAKSSIRFLKLKSISSISSLPASIFEKSSISLRSNKSDSPLFFTVFAY